MSLFYQLDKEATKSKAKSVLKTYRRLKQIAGEAFLPKVTATYSFEPRQPHSTHSSTIEKHVIRQQTALKKMQVIEQAINKLEVDDRYILIRKYCQRPTSDIAIYMDLEVSESEFYRQLDKAYCAFAEVYQGGELLVFQNGKGVDDFLGEIC